MYRKKRTLVQCLGFIACLAVGAGATPAAYAGSAAKMLVSHRAVYEMSLDQADDSSHIASARGRMVYEAVNMGCEGLAVNQRVVFDMTFDDGLEALSDLRHVSYEVFDGSLFRFSMRRYFNSEISEDHDGQAVRQDNGEVRLILKNDSEERILAAGVMFPNAYLTRVIEAAMQEERFFESHVFDGSDLNQNLSATSIIGAAALPGLSLEERGAGIDAAPLKTALSWPVTISYFENDSQDSTPQFVLSMRIFENGVASSIYFDYGNFQMTGKLSMLEFLDQEPC